MDFKKIKEQLSDRKPISFLKIILSQPSEKDSIFTFSQTIENQFETNVNYLLSEETVSPEELSSWKKNGFLVVAQTIDGDYIAGIEKQTFVIPVSLYKSDIETYDLTLSDFFISYSEGKIKSQILPKI